MNPIHLKRAALAGLGLAAVTTISACASDHSSSMASGKMDHDKDEQTINMAEVPAAAQQTLKAEAGGAAISSVEKETKDGKAVYEGKTTINGKPYEIKVAADGTLLKKKLEMDEDDEKDGEHHDGWNKGEKDDDEKGEAKGKEDDDDDKAPAMGGAKATESKEAGEAGEENEVKLAWASVPANVKATLTAQARGAKIDSVDKELRAGKTVYETDVMLDGKNHEIVIGEDGKLVSNGVDEEEDEKK